MCPTSTTSIRISLLLICLLSLATLTEANLAIGRLGMYKGPKRSPRSLSTGRLNLFKPKRGEELLPELIGSSCATSLEESLNMAETLLRMLQEELAKIEACEAVLSQA